MRSAMTKTNRKRERYLFRTAIRILHERLGRKPTVDEIIGFTKRYQQLDQHERERLYGAVNGVVHHAGGR
jgi:hypothetical protein